MLCFINEVLGAQEEGEPRKDNADNQNRQQKNNTIYDLSLTWQSLESLAIPIMTKKAEGVMWFGLPFAHTWKSRVLESLGRALLMRKDTMIG